jgi:hypothetical protein
MELTRIIQATGWPVGLATVVLASLYLHLPSLQSAAESGSVLPCVEDVLRTIPALHVAHQRRSLGGWQSLTRFFAFKGTAVNFDHHGRIHTIPG